MKSTLLSLGLALVLLAGSGATGLAAQDPTTPRAAGDSLVSDSVTTSRVSPGGAFLRSMLVPGWGQASVGAYNRAGFYFAVDAVSALMFLKSARTLGTARENLERLEDRITAELIEEGTTDPQAIEEALAQVEAVEDARGLVDSRGQQREDWLAFGIFMLVVGGADAFVAGHLADFPEPIEAGFRVLPGGGLEAGLSIRLPHH